MEQPVKAPHDCDDACLGTEADVQTIRTSLIDRETSSEMADWFKAFSDPTRLRIIDALLQKELCVHDLTVLLDMGQSAISHQFALSPQHADCEASQGRQDRFLFFG